MDLSDRRHPFASNGKLALVSPGGRWLLATTLVLGGVGVSPLPAQRVFTTTDLDSAMKAVGRYFDLATRAIAARDVEIAKARIARAREQLAPTYSFWLLEKRPDAMKMLKEATAALDDLDAVLSKSSVEPSAMSAATARVDRACQACHAIYREEDTATKTFQVKAPGREP